MKPLQSIVLVAAWLSLFGSLQAAAPTSNAEQVGRMPEFSWDRVPLYVHIRKDTAFTDAEIRYLATFPLITFEKATGHKDSGSVEAGTLKVARAVKAVNPQTKILYYRNVIVHYGSYAANEKLADIPGAFLVARSGKEKLIRNRVQAYDLTNSAMRDWWTDAAMDVCSDPAIDGVFLDGVVKVLEPAFLKREIGEEKKDAVLAGYVNMMDETRKRLGPQKLMVANLLRARFEDSGLSNLKHSTVLTSKDSKVPWGCPKKTTLPREFGIFKKLPARVRSLPSHVDWDEISKMRMKRRIRLAPSRNPQDVFGMPRAVSIISWPFF